uniref:Uncharacterized protein n=1 Tax=Anguilla anguilla TaxID=7936 RepID=A0A0E9VXT2_ANGAN
MINKENQKRPIYQSWS